MNEPAIAPQNAPSDIEGTDRPQKQAPGYNELDRETGLHGETNEAEPEFGPGDDPATRPVNSGMQGEGEPGRALRDSTGGIEGSPDNE